MTNPRDPEPKTPGVDMTPADVMEQYAWAMRNARRNLKEALEQPAGSGGRGVEAASAHAFILFAQEIRAGYDITLGRQEQGW